MKTQTLKYLKRKGMAPSALADRAGIGRWIVVRWLKDKDADITMKSWKKLSTYMSMNP